MTSKTVTVKVNIRTPRFAWVLAGQSRVWLLGAPLSRALRAAILFILIRRLKRKQHHAVPQS